MNRPFRVVAILIALAPCAAMCTPPTAIDWINARRAGQVGKNPRAQALSVVNREFIGQDATRRARQYADGGGRYVAVYETVPPEIPPTVHTVIGVLSIRNSNVLYLPRKP